MFTDRTDAGEQLGAYLASEGVEADIVLGIPRGALPVARPVADKLGATLDVVVASKIGAPGNPELALGAVASDGSHWLNEELVEQLQVADEYLEREQAREAEAAHEKAVQYRDNGDFPAVSGKQVIVVDDGVATGATAIACLRQVADAGAAHVTLAVPVGSPRSLNELETDEPAVDAVIALERPANFRAVGQYYQDFRQVSDKRARSYLDE
ncbi:putative phosphoribosyltransferase (plasmid) [Natrialba magadii ATCC 43099]|uniref:Phosphoribosyltransferase n=1 Tax=Natrialba magadii (strain ATCC 43099 / DSM 3394 / CCM 3739 / CIP 104546 / IAM 13178 / JCM 8861 / NBRC 102185 / NCIMB 2190 / MS3) TaxID=547559 RepID=D3T0Q8_NATMM|nr:phosphoribosyltransferase family protein [Natrialba magadii]ADD07167.1 putative phosphoribosyltransferase [Natrialba magadii ATCC 43099]ELY34574.1 phosphoribosyltransferase [Natrialba magadii ATCC 43099]